MIQNKIAKALDFARAHGHTDAAKILAIVHGEMRDFAKRMRVESRDQLLNDGDANDIIKRHLRHAGITLQMKPGDPTAELVIDILSEFLVEDVMSDTEMRERIKASGLTEPRQILKHLTSFGGAVDMNRARIMVRNVFGD